MLSAILLAASVTLPVPFVAQQKDTCGAAALAMVMGYYGAAPAHDAIAAALVEPELHGIRGSSLADFARARGMVAIAFAGDVALLREHLTKGRPLVVSVSAGRGRYHDVVAIGVDDARGVLVVNDPAEGAGRRWPLAKFEKRWSATGRWTLLVQPAAAGEAGPADASGADATARPRNDEVPAAEAGAAPVAGSYDALVAEAVELGRGGRSADAAQRLERAIALAPARPEAWTERGGLRFLDGKYDEAALDLRRSLALREDAYARDLLASSLQMAGRELEALAAWNPLGQPALGSVELGGLVVTRDAVARREIGIEPGATLTPGALRAARRRLEETGAFDRLTLRPRPRGDGTADLEVALSERHGLARGPADFLVTTGVNLAWQRLRLRYSNIGGTGIAVGGSYRWQEKRPETSLQLQWPRPLGLPVYARATGFRGEQSYALGGVFGLRRRGGELGLRHVVGEGTLVSATLRLRERDFSAARPDAPDGRLVGLELALDGPLLETRRHRVEGTLRVFGAGAALGSQVRYAQADAELRYEGVLSARAGRSVERAVLAARLRGGWGSSGLPLDEMYAPGLSPESDLPLRAHPLTRGGAIGANPVGRSVVLFNAEWRQRVLHRAAFDLGLVGFVDAASVGRVAQGSAPGSLVDAGIGLRVVLLAGPTLRVDHAWGLSDGRRAIYVGLGQAF